MFEADVCVIGAGAAGITIAHEFVRKQLVEQSLKASAWLSRSERPAAVEGLFYQLFADLSAARMLGRRYLADHSNEHSREWLIKKVLKGARPRNLEALRAVLANNLRRDFSEGYIVIVDGWVLSRTEARAAAIVFCSQTG